LNLGENTVNVVLALLLVGSYGARGLALAYSVAYLVSAAVTLVVLHRRVGGLGEKGLATGLVKLGVATAVTGVAVWAVTRSVGGVDGAAALVRVAVAVLVGVAVYVAALVVLRADELRAVRAQVVTRRRMP
jgi:putative peptidoglycan lipid II flippase